jgi:hypothetical protein
LDLELQFLHHGASETVRAHKAGISVIFSDFLKFKGELLIILLELIFSLLGHGELSLEVLCLILRVMDIQLKLGALLPRFSQVLPQHVDYRLQFFNIGQFFVQHFDLIVFALKFNFLLMELVCLFSKTAN